MRQTIGVLGGGQLGKMLFEAGSPLNTPYVFLEKSKDCPASKVCSNQLVGTLQDSQSIRSLSQQVDILTFEIEHVNVVVLEELVKEGKRVIPSPSVLSIIQDKGLQKDFYMRHGIPTLPYQNTTTEGLRKDVESWPDTHVVLKHRKGGYDGKGVQLLSKKELFERIDANDESLQSNDGYVIEKRAQEPVEVSVIVAVDQHKQAVTYAPSEMVFDPQSNLMDYLICPSSLSEETNALCEQIALKSVRAFGSPGLFAVELFVQPDGQVFVNEIAPRPHNSGHHTIESTYTSQYEQLNRILLGQPLGDTSLIQHAATCNIVGPADIYGGYHLHQLDEVLSIPGVYIHMYGKSETLPNRKLGHYTILGESRSVVEEKLTKVKKLLSVKSN